MADTVETESADLERYIQEKVASGDYRSREEFLLEAARWYRAAEREFLAGLREEVQRRIALADAGQTGPLDMAAIKTEGRRRLAERQSRE